jgi:beta-glucanase (GH16 family)
MASGAVFGLFAYRADHFTQPWIELDFEFVGAETREVRLNVHMEGRRGRRITLEEAAGGPVIVPLGFDAAEAPHLYEIDLSAHQAVFRIDARVVGRVTPADLAIRAWTRGPMRGYTNLWAVDETLEPWAGRWADPGRLLRARIEGLGLRPAV